jgi:putative membrane-bound dehydrogenase-like protein
MRDTDGDGLSDTQEPWLTGFLESNSQLLVNDPHFGIDLRLYIANGLRSASIQQVHPGWRQRESLDIRTRDLRLDVRDGQWQSITGPAQFGIAWDRWGHRYFCSNRNPCDAVLLEQDHASVTPLLGLAPLARPVVPAGEASAVHPLTQAWTTSNLHAGQFSAACGLLVSGSLALPLLNDTQGPSPWRAHALTCEPTGNLVHRRTIDWVQGQPKVVDPDSQQEWLASRDPWFRPVFLAEGPDAAVYVVDMYRAVIEHPAWVPDELKTRPDERFGDDRGRIYRVISASDDDHANVLDELRQRPLRSRTSAELVQLLAHSNEWMRSTAAQLLLERIHFEGADAGPVGADLHALMADAADDVAVRVAYTLHALHRLEHSALEKLIARPSLAVRCSLWKLVADNGIEWPGMYAFALQQLKEARLPGDAEWVRNIAWSVARHSAADVDDAWLDLAAGLSAQGTDDLHGLSALTASCRQQPTKFLVKWRQAYKNRGHTDVPVAFVQRLAQYCQQQDQAHWANTLAAELQAIEKTAMGVGSPWDPRELWEARWRIAMVAGSIKSKVTLLDPQSSIWSWLKEIALNNQQDGSLSLESMELLAHAPLEQVRDYFPVAVGKVTDPKLLSRAIASWSKTQDPACTQYLLDQVANCPPRQRTEYFGLLMQNPSMVEALIGALESGKLSLKRLDASQIQGLKSVRSPELQPRIAKLLADSVDANRAKVIEQYQSCLALEADLQRGRELFRQHCASCHKLDGQGFAVGPDISDSRVVTPQQLLLSILDPNRAIDSNFFRYLVVTTDGTVHDGILAEETSASVTLRSQNGKVAILDRQEIDQWRPAGVSLMPEGVESQIGLQAMADLIHYIKYWRYEPAGIPAARLGK